MRNFIAEGCALAVLAPVALTEGQGIVLGSLFGVAAGTLRVQDPCVRNPPGLRGTLGTPGAGCKRGERGGR
jgi:hypothetical protein